MDQQQENNKELELFTKPAGVHCWTWLTWWWKNLQWLSWDHRETYRIFSYI